MLLYCSVQQVRGKLQLCTIIYTINEHVASPSSICLFLSLSVSPWSTEQWVLCYARCLRCPKNFNAQSDLVLFCASDNKRLELEWSQKPRIHGNALVRQLANWLKGVFQFKAWRQLVLLYLSCHPGFPGHCRGYQVRLSHCIVKYIGMGLFFSCRGTNEK